MTPPTPDMPEPSNADMALIPDSVAAWIDWQAQQIAALESQLDLAAPSQWRDISSAPRDGTWILGYVSNDDTFHEYAQIRWMSYHWLCDDGKEFHNPTHWQPLPQPPTLKEKI